MSLKIKFLAKTAPDQDLALWSSLIPGNGFKNIEYSFDLNDKNYDYLAVYEGLPPLPNERKVNRVETLACHPKNTLLITTEPSSIRLDGPYFLRQFGHVLTNKHPDLVRHPNRIKQTPPLRWFYGRPMGGDGRYKTVDQMIDDGPPAKSKDLSTVCSTKQMAHTVHAKRLEFVMALREAMPELSVYGRGIRPIDEKSEAMDDYRYHIAIENHQEPGHWTEKLSDCFLAGCLPLYFGDPDYAKAFPKEAVIPIDIYDFDGAVQTISDAIETDQYTKRLPHILEARNKVLTEYNILKVIADIAREKHVNMPATGAKIYGRHIFRKNHPMKAASDAIFRMRMKNHSKASPLQG